MAKHPTNSQVRLVDGEFWAHDPHPHLLWLRDNAPVYWDEFGQIWGIALYEDVMSVSRDPASFSNSGGIRPDAPDMPYMIGMDDPEHKRRRGLVNKGFTLRRVADREARIREICVDLIERNRQRGSFDFVKDLASWLPLIVIGDSLGVEPDAYDNLLRWSDDMVKATGATDPERVAAGSTAFFEYSQYQMQVIADRRAKPPQNDLVSILVHAEIDGERLTDDQILWESLLILIGGDETTRHVISGGMYELLRHPQQWQRLIAYPEKIPTAVEEMLRWVTPIKNMMRTAMRDVELRGQTIRQGERALLLYPSANRDAAVFSNPLEFNIERAPNDHIAFGYGAHFCLGASLARLELRVMFEELARRMPTIELASDAPPPHRPSNFISGIESLPVRVG